MGEAAQEETPSYRVFPSSLCYLSADWEDNAIICKYLDCVGKCCSTLSRSLEAFWYLYRAVGHELGAGCLLGG